MNHRLGSRLVLGLVVFLAVVTVFPFLLIVMNSVKSPADYSTKGPLGLPSGIYLDGITDFWVRVDFGEKLLNSTVIAASVAVLAVLVAILMAYALGIGRIKGRTWIVAVFLLANLMPQEALVYPLYFVAKEFGLYDTKLAVIIIFTAIQSAFGVYLLSSVLSTFPREIIEAARIDGANRWQVLWRVVVPVARNGIFATAVFAFIFSWNEFLFALVLTRTQVITYPVQITQYFGAQSTFWAKISAMSVLGTLPVFFAVAALQRYLVRGISLGAIKG
jgi:raffinose/stachyose/melibiose transport system permease protein